MHSIIFNMAGMHRHGTAFYDFLRLRKTFFVDQLGWDIPHDDDVEMDQYDNPQAWYVLVQDEDEEVVAGGRFLPSSAKWGSHTYMLNDAHKGRIDSIPSHLMEGMSVASRTWEVTRLVISDSLATHAERSLCMKMIMEGAESLLLRLGGDEAISLSPPLMVRALRALGWDVKRQSDPYLCEDGRQYAVLSIPMRAQKGVATATLAAALGAPPFQSMPSHRAQSMMVHAPQKD